MSPKNIYRVFIKTPSGHLYYLSDNDMSTPGVGPDGKTNIDTFNHEDNNLAFLSNCLPKEVYHFSTKKKAEEAIKNLPFPYNERCQIIGVSEATNALYKRIYYRIGKIKCPIGVSWCNAEGSFINEMPSGPQTLFTDKTVAEEFLSNIKNAPVGASVFEFYDFGAPDFKFLYKTNSGAIYNSEGKIEHQRSDIKITDCNFGDVGIPQYVFYRFLKRTSEGLAWLCTDDTFKKGIFDETLSLYTLNDAKKYAKINSIDTDVEIVEIYSGGDPDWKWNYKILSTGKVYNSSSQEIA